MGALWRARTAVASTIKGWLCVWLLLFVLWMPISLRVRGHPQFTDLLSIWLIWVVATGIVSLAATIFLIVPYVCLRSTDTLLRRPWLIYVESGVLATLACVVLTHFAKPTAETFWTSFKPYLMIALVTSLTSAFYMQRIKSISKKRTLSKSE